VYYWSDMIKPLYLYAFIYLWGSISFCGIFILTVHMFVFQNLPQIYLVLFLFTELWIMWSHKVKSTVWQYHVMGNWWWRFKGITFLLPPLFLFKHLGFSVFLGDTHTLSHDSNQLTHQLIIFLIPKNQTMPLFLTSQLLFLFEFSNGSSCTILSFFWSLRFQICHINGIYFHVFTSHILYLSLTCPFFVFVFVNELIIIVKQIFGPAALKKGNFEQTHFGIFTALRLVPIFLCLPCFNRVGFAYCLILR